MAQADNRIPTIGSRPSTNMARVEVAIEAAKAAGSVLRDGHDFDLEVREKDSSAHQHRDFGRFAIARSDRARYPPVVSQ